ncbi:hypothetical protein TEA_013517 [Camellia sinensis var. sinensis]|uniref:Uncharacterized protein n=1 Tax=Camellia sinensis var. sinensis TaxID=542762 RepID=A0A4S4D0V6_CAMSN|nr:hypothetical protein TEA_013517 [Camellia sinensis var. sinensis]
MASFLPFVLQNLNSLIQKEVGLLWGVDKEMKKLSSTLTTIQAVLEDAQQKQFQEKAIQNWLRKLNDAAHEVEDILDDCTTEALQYESKRLSSSSLKKLRSCTNCLVLPAFGQLPSLRRLEISKMDYVEYIDNYFPGGSPVRGFPALEVLCISQLPNLVGLSREEGRELLPCLHKIDINNCPKLTLPRLSSPKLLKVWFPSNVVLSSISNLKNLTTLSVHRGYMISFPEEMLQNLTVLESLEIERFSNLKVLPTNLESLVSLKSLRIWWCGEIESLPDHGLRSQKSLQRLTIKHCNNLSSLSESLGHLTALEELNVSGCPKLVTLPDSIKHLVSLRHLHIGYSELKTLPEALKHVPALQSLFIACCKQLTSLPEWLGNLTSLQSLYIFYCRKIPSLPDGFERLTNLQTLTIMGCGPELLRRCQKEKGEDWYKIAKIPKIDLTIAISFSRTTNLYSSALSLARSFTRHCHLRYPVV